MSPDKYGAWTLILQVSAYLGYLDFGIQTAVGRFVADANEKGDAAHRNRIVSTSFAWLTAAGMLGMLGSTVVAFFWPRIFSHTPTGLLTEAKGAFLLVAVSLALGLPFSVFNGVFIGLQRNEVPASIIAISRIISAAAVVLVVEHQGTLISMAFTVATVNLLSYFAQYVMYRKVCPRQGLSSRLVSMAAGRELFHYCLSLTVWSFGMLLVTGLDLTLVGIFQFNAVAFYAAAASMVTFITGLQGAIFSAMVSPVAVLNARGDARGVARIMISATRYGTFLLLLTGLPLVLFAKPILDLWVGTTYGASGARLLEVLAAANIIRLSATPYVMTLVGTGQQRLVILTPLIEGLTNVIVSIVAGLAYGAIGVALGTLVGACVGFMLNLAYNMHRTHGCQIRVSSYLRDGLARPAVCALPSISYIVLTRTMGTVVAGMRYVSLLAAFVGTVFLVWRCGLLGSERERLRALCWLPGA